MLVKSDNQSNKHGMIIRFLLLISSSKNFYFQKELRLRIARGIETGGAHSRGMYNYLLHFMYSLSFFR